ncbi:MAG: hypothetical protein DRO98_00645 [Archaeoglobales archaeon]|nr:MAG: hypothetical protein DRO98_00645 [Archaeoglobales archaeon]
MRFIGYGIDPDGEAVECRLAYSGRTSFNCCKAGTEELKITEKRKEDSKSGSIHANSEPEGTLVYLDNVYAGRTPTKIDGVPAGVHTVRSESSAILTAEGVRSLKQVRLPSTELMEIPEIKLSVG